MTTPTSGAVHVASQRLSLAVLLAPAQEAGRAAGPVGQLGVGVASPGTVTWPILRPGRTGLPYMCTFTPGSAAITWMYRS